MNLQELNELDFENIGSWPAPAKIVLMAVLAIAIGAGGYFWRCSLYVLVPVYT